MLENLIFLTLGMILGAVAAFVGCVIAVKGMLKKT